MGLGDLRLTGDVGLCQQEQVGAVHLRRDDLGQLRIRALQCQVDSIDKHQRHAGPEIRVDPRKIHDPSRVGHTTCLDQDMVDGLTMSHQRDHRIDQPTGK